METVEKSSSGDGFLSRMALNDNKAGMKGLDRDKINKIIMDSSKGSRFYENELKREQQVNQRIEKMMQQKANITEQQLSKAQAQVEKMTSDLERSRDLSRVIVHVDMDAFYAAVEMRDCPDLKDKPMAVGTMSMLSTSNYHARKFGVRAGMPGFIAKKLCPNLVIVPNNFDKYKEVSAEIREIFADYDPHFLPMSLDEAYLDITEHLDQRRLWPDAQRTHRTGTDGVEKQDEGSTISVEVENLSPLLFESPCSSPTAPPQDLSVCGARRDMEVFGTCAEEAVREMRFRIQLKTLLTASAGIAPNMMLAKVCSDMNKPNGQYKLPSTRPDIMAFIQDLPVRKVSGIGKVTETLLGALGISNCPHLGQEMALLSLLFSETSWHQFLHISLGLGSSHIQRDGERKSMSIERTFGEMSALEEQFSLCRELCHDLALDLQKEALKGKTVTLKLKNVNFEVKTRAWTLPCAVASTEELFAVAKDLLKTEMDNVSPQPLRLRLMGVRVSSFVSVDDKKPLQKSIVGFLQQGGRDSNSFSQISSNMPVKENHATQEGPSWLPSQGGVEVGRSGEQQLSFFQRVHAERLRLQAEKEDPPEGVGNLLETRLDPASLASSSPGRHTLTQTHSATRQMTHGPTSNPPGRHTLTHTHSATGQMTHGPTSNTTGSTSSCWSTEPDGLTCPVCFRTVNTNVLAVFNKHIDRCLTGPPMGLNNHAHVEQEVENDREEQEVENERNPFNRSMLDKVGPQLDCSTGGHTETTTGLLLFETRTFNISLNTLDLNPACLNSGGVSIPRGPDPNSLNGSVHNDTGPLACLVSPEGPQPCFLSRPESHDWKSPNLTCPVCQVTQDTSDLALFNRHVDLCLNQEVLHELGGRGSVEHTTTNAPPAAQKERKQALQTVPQKGKSKRRGSSPPNPSKKSKVHGTTRNTIDKFFR